MKTCCKPTNRKAGGVAFAGFQIVVFAPPAEAIPDGLSPYNYVLDKPLALIDPDGRQVRVNDLKTKIQAGMARQQV